MLTNEILILNIGTSTTNTANTNKVQDKRKIFLLWRKACITVLGCSSCNYYACYKIILIGFIFSVMRNFSLASLTDFLALSVRSRNSYAYMKKVATIMWCMMHTYEYHILVDIHVQKHVFVLVYAFAWENHVIITQVCIVTKAVSGEYTYSLFPRAEEGWWW